MTVNKLQLPAKNNAIQLKINEIIDNLGGGGAVDQTYDPTSVNAQSGVAILGLLETIYPVGSVYLSTTSTCPLASLFGTWTLVSSGKALWTGTGSNGDTTKSAGLPAITGSVSSSNTTYGGWNVASSDWSSDKAFTLTTKTNLLGFSAGSSRTTRVTGFTFSAANSNTIYGSSTTVQPPAYVVNVWKRTA